MKTEKYFIEFDCCENNMSTEIEISKKEFQRQLKFLRVQIAETKADETPVEELSPIRRDFGTTEKTVYAFHCACARTFLTELKCKTGYRFKNKGEK